VATKKVTIEVEVSEEVLERAFVETLKKNVWELYLTYRWLRLPEAPPEAIEELSREAKRAAWKEKRR